MEKEQVMLVLPSIHFNFDNNNDNDDEDFDFNFNSLLQRPSLSADQLFHGGKILPLKPIQPPTTHKSVKSPPSSFSEENKLGRERASSFSILSSRKGSEKTSFTRISDSNRYSTSVTESNKKLKTSASTFTSFFSSISFSKGYRKWRIKDFLLFRSASEGRGTDRDSLRKYTLLSKTTAYEDVGNSSFRSTVDSGSVSKRRNPVSAHELHYTMNRAASEELKRKTMLPYKQGLLGCLGFNHGMNQISGRFRSLERS